MATREPIMSEKQVITHDSETHDQFVQRLNKVFPPECAMTWSRLERLIFNQLMGQLIFKHGYRLISNAMLDACRDEMFQVVRNLSERQHCSPCRPHFFLAKTESGNDQQIHRDGVNSVIATATRGPQRNR